LVRDIFRANKQKENACDWLAISLVFFASQSRGCFSRSREQIRLVENMF
jgi:hypothetical protein